MEKRLIFLLCLFYLHVVAQDYSSINILSQLYPNRSFVVFPEYRENSIQWFDSLRTKWLDKHYKEKFHLQAQPGEYFTYQLAVCAQSDLDNVKVRFSTLKSTSGEEISIQNMTCFNTGGIDYKGKSFTKNIKVESGRVQSLWIGVDLEKIPIGTYMGEVTVISNNQEDKIPLQLTVSGNFVNNRGYNEGWRMSRLDWLNSRIAIDDEIVKPYIPLKRSNKTISFLGRDFEIQKNGLPASIQTYFTPSVQSITKNGENLLHSPFLFIIEDENNRQIKLKPQNICFEEESPSKIKWTVKSSSEQIDMFCQGTIEPEGFIDYQITLQAKKDLRIKDIRMEIPMKKNKSRYMMGLHQEGGLRPKGTYNWKWDVSKNQDMLWIGDVNGGIRIKWKAENYVRPLVNIYYKFGPLKLPNSWGNEGKGGVSISEQEKNVVINAYSGSRVVKQGEKLHYDFELLVTPFRTIDKKVQFGDRYFHGGGTDESTKVAQAEKGGANIINIHHAGDLYPFINYPYLDDNVEDLKRIVDDAHTHGKLMKFYYTTRELTKNIPEFWAFNSLNGEIIYPGPGNDSKTYHLHPNGPAEWLKQNLREKYIPAWYNPIDRGKFKGEIDLSVITTPDSRLNNFYIAGLDWMIRNMDLDGVYIDDSAIDRTTLRRARKVIDRNRPLGKMDLHSCNHYDPYFGYSSCLNMYMDLLPYFDLCWIGEGRNYDRLPDHWLIEVSGIPFGLPGQMLQGGGNPWRGMVYGITNRLGYGGMPTSVIWEFWDKYHIEEKEMVGYWDKNNPISVNHDKVKATIYKGAKESIISIASWSDQDVTCKVDINWKKLGYKSFEYQFNIPEVSGFQTKQLNVDLKGLYIPKGKGYLIVVQHK